MRISPHYPAIKSRAIEMLRAGTINNHPWEELRTMAHARCGDWGWWTVRNSVGVALCMARDELWDKLIAPLRPQPEDKPTMDQIRKFNRGINFNNGNHKLAEREIIHELRGGV